MHRSNLFVAFLASTSCLAPAGGGALPSGGVVSAGSATIGAPAAGNLAIKQGSNRAVIDWRQFNIGGGEKVSIAQPSSASILLNRIHDQQPSQIFGQIKANGQVILSNPNGIVFGPTSRVDVAGLIATTAGISNDAFMLGSKLSFSQPGKASAKISSQGRIDISQSGLAALVAPNVDNSGVIVAKAGRIKLAGGDTFTLDLYGDGLLSVAASDALSQQVGNSGVLQGADVALTTADAKNAIDNVINLDGVVEATSLNGDGGHITAKADGGNLVVSGLLDASGTRGGDVFVMSDNATRVTGSIKALGSKGAGGKIETSSHGHLGVSGHVDAGANGSWLLDPTDVTITNGAGANASAGGTFNGLSIDASTIQTALNAGTSVTVTTTSGGTDAGNMFVTGATIHKTTAAPATLTLQANHNINLFNSTIDSNSGPLGIVIDADSGGLHAGSVGITSTTLGTNGGALTIGGGATPLTTYAWGEAVNAGVGVTLSTATVSTAGGALNINGRGQDAAGDFHYGVLFSTGTTVQSTGGSITLNGTGGNGTGNNYGVNVLGGSITTQTGAININGQGGIGTGNSNSGIKLQSGLVLSSTNAAAAPITVTGSGGNANTLYNDGIEFSGNNTRIVTSTGNIVMTGTSPSVGAGGIGIYLNPTGASGGLSSTGAATISLNGTGSSGNFNAYGVRLSSGKIQSVTGAILINALSRGLFTNNDGLLIDGGGIASTGNTAAAATITLNGTSPVGTTGNHGIEMSNNSYVTSVDGAIQLNGTGRGTSSTSSGIYLQSGAYVESTGSGASAATIALNGTGGTGNGATDFGIYLNGNACATNSGCTGVRTVDGAVGLIGLARGTLTGKNGIEMDNAARIDSTGTGAITLNGTSSATGTTSNSGIELTGARTIITSANGSIALTGTNATGAVGHDDSGIRLAAGASVTSTGAGVGAAHITLTGVANGTTYNQNGILIDGSGTLVTAQDGAIVLSGTGGDGTGDSNAGVQIQNSAAITSTGNTATAATIQLTGISGDGNNDNDGISLLTSTHISTVRGNVTLSGTGRGSGYYNDGIEVLDSSYIESTGLSGAAGSLTIGGKVIGGVRGDNRGIIVYNGSYVTSAYGDIGLTGLTSGYSPRNYGIDLDTNAAITSTGTGGGAAAITLNGTGSSLGGGNGEGIILANTSTISSVRGAIGLTGSGAGTGGDNAFGVQLVSGSSIASTGTGGSAATITLSGTGGNSSGNNAYGIYLNGNNCATNSGCTAISTVDGAVSLTGIGGGGGTQENGIEMDLASRIDSTGIGTVTLAGTSSATGVTGNIGIELSNARTSINSATGNIALTGSNATGTTGHDNMGVRVVSSAAVSSNGSGASAAHIDITGVGVGSTYNNRGILIDTNALVTAQDGAIHLIGTGAIGASDNNSGIVVTGAGAVTSTGSGASAASITLNGTGGATGNDNNGIYLHGNGTAGSASVTSAAGAISLTGTGHGTGTNNDGIKADNGAAVSSSGAGAIAFTGIGTASGHGVYVGDATTRVQTATGGITFSGTGGASTSDGIDGIKIDSGAVISSSAVTAGNGNITFTGLGGNGANYDYGVDIIGSVSTVAGSVALTGTGSGTGGGAGVVIETGGSVASSSAIVGGDITLIGAGGAAGGMGIVMGNGSITSSKGPIALTGNVGNVSGSSGIYLYATDSVNSTTGAITLTGKRGGTNASGMTAAGTSIAIGSAADTGNIILIGDTISLANTTVRTQNDITVKPDSINTPIGLAGGTGTLLLDATTLGSLHADNDANGTGTLIIGRPDGTGDLHANAYSAWNSNVKWQSNTGQLYVDGAQDFGGHAITFSTNADPHLTAAIGNASNFTLSSQDGTTAIGLGGASGTINLSDAELDNLASTVSLITFTNSPVTVDAYNNWRSAVAFSGTTNSVTGNQAAGSGGSASMAFTGATSLSANIDLSAAAGNRAVVFHSPVTVAADSSVTSAGTGAITFDSTIDGGHNLTLASGGTITLSGDIGTGTPLGAFSATSGASLVLPNITAGSVYAKAGGATSDLTIAAGKTLSASGTGDAITLIAGRDFKNLSGAGALVTPGVGARWLINSTNPASDVVGGLVAAFHRYNCNLSVSCPTYPAAGNGFLYHYQPLLTVTPNALGGSVTYGNAAVLTNYGYTLSSYIGGDGALDTVTGTLNGSSPYAPGSGVGSYSLDHASGTLASALGYGFTYASNATGITVVARPLTIQASDATRNAGDPNPAFGYSVVNLYGSDPATLVSGVSVSSPATIASPVGTYAINASGAMVASANYTIGSYLPGTLTVGTSAPPVPSGPPPVPVTAPVVVTRPTSGTTPPVTHTEPPPIGGPSFSATTSGTSATMIDSLPASIRRGNELIVDNDGRMSGTARPADASGDVHDGEESPRHVEGADDESLYNGKLYRFDEALSRLLNVWR